jgi:cell division protein FtsB
MKYNGKEVNKFQQHTGKNLYKQHKEHRWWKIANRIINVVITVLLLLFVFKYCV